MQFFSAIRKNETTWFEGKWMQLEDIIVSEARFRKSKTACFLSYVEDKSKR
jgi:hypothetical protein